MPVMSMSEKGDRVIDAAVLTAVGISAHSGKREVLGCSVALSEQEIHWRNFLQSLKQRGLHGVELIVSDAHEGLLAAKQTLFSTVPWQRCQVHLQRNAQSYLPRREMREAVAADIRAIFNAPNRSEAERLLDQLLDRYADSAPRLVRLGGGGIAPRVDRFCLASQTSPPSANDQLD